MEKKRRSSRVRKQVRERMERTGEKYTVALRAIEAQREQRAITELDKPLDEHEEVAAQKEDR